MRPGFGSHPFLTEPGPVLPGVSLVATRHSRNFCRRSSVARRIYPLAYNKWIREQVADRLALPKLYEELPPILSVGNIERDRTG